MEWNKQWIEENTTEDEKPQEFDGGFFSNSERGLDIPSSDEGPEQEAGQVADPLDNWRFIVNRAFMRGVTMRDIISAIGDRIDARPDKDDIISYMRRYEGLIGVLFADASVLEAGLKNDEIPQRLRAFWTFAVNSRSRRIETTRTYEACKSGDIDEFLSATEQASSDFKEIDTTTGLPVFKKGMLTSDVLASAIERLGGTGCTLAAFKALAREKLLGIKPSRKVDTRTGDFNYGLADGGMNIEYDKTARHAMASADIGLKQAGIDKIEIQPMEKNLDVGMPAPSDKVDIDIQPARKLVEVKMPAPSRKEDVSFEIQEEEFEPSRDMAELVIEMDSPADEPMTVEYSKPQDKLDVNYADVPNEYDVEFDNEFRF